ncbi:MAG: sugar transferase [Coriobacteriales bacterium]|jgi:lipopolysaccharide/colanic/teichoic acid biosynthesis glycosyltransferase|nr:sugar transferase [Coriobacteriales bacterium]
MYERVVKRILDLILGIIVLPFFGLAILIIAPLVFFEDRGPVFYNAARVGKDRKVFIMYKFRTMKVNSPDLKMSDGSTYNDPNDPRATKIGNFLRRTSLDELPQVLNVLKGDMSFIGPRPDLEDEVALYFEGESEKLTVKPGLSGYAQVYGRNAIAWHDRITLDIYYVQHFGFALDMKILFRTISSVFLQKDIYVAASAEQKGNGGDRA